MAPIGVNVAHPKLKGTSGCPCFGSGNPTTLPLGKTGAPGAFDLLNVDRSHGGTGAGHARRWILKGLDAYMPLGDYYSDAGAKWNSSQVQSALTARIGTELLFPVYRLLTGSGANAQYHVVAWVGFHLTGFTARGSAEASPGASPRYVASGIQATTRAADPTSALAPSTSSTDPQLKDKEQWHIEHETS